MTLTKLLTGIALPLAAGLLCVPAQAQFTQQGSKLVGTGATGNAEQGYSVALSSDGSTAVVGGPFDNGNIGAAWIYTQTNGAWTQQGLKLVGTNAVGNGQQGYSVALSSDGNTAIVGGPFDNNNAGAAWIYTRTNGAWTQQGLKLVGTGAVGAAEQGVSVALSSDGNTALVSGWVDNSNTGAVWVFTRSNGAWTQQGAKLVGSGAAGSAYQGHSVSLSQDGNTALVGGYLDNTYVGAAWVWVRNGTAWSQQGSKLVGTGATGSAQQGYGVALSGDGNTAVVGGNDDAGNIGAAWIFTRSGTTWSQQGSKLAGTGDAPSVGVQQGYSVGISTDGNTVAVGGPVDNFNAGATWVYTRSAGVWTQQGQKLVGTGAVGPVVTQGRAISMSGDASTLLVGSNQDNGQVGAVWVFTQPTTPAPLCPFFDGQTISGGILYLTFPDTTVFGYYVTLGNSWIYHADLGYEYVAPGSNTDVYLWDLASGHWWYTNAGLFPYLYDFTLNTWLYYFPSSTVGHYTTDPRSFANMTTGQIFSM